MTRRSGSGSRLEGEPGDFDWSQGVDSLAKLQPRRQVAGLGRGRPNGKALESGNTNRASLDQGAQRDDPGGRVQPGRQDSGDGRPRTISSGSGTRPTARPRSSFRVSRTWRGAWRSRAAEAPSPPAATMARSNSGTRSPAWKWPRFGGLATRSLRSPSHREKSSWRRARSELEGLGAGAARYCVSPLDQDCRRRPGCCALDGREDAGRSLDEGQEASSWWTPKRASSGSRSVVTWRTWLRACLLRTGKRLFTSDEGGVVKGWETATGKQVASFEARKKGASALALGDNGRILATSGEDKSLKVLGRPRLARNRSDHRVEGVADGTRGLARWDSGGRGDPRCGAECSQRGQGLGCK